MTDLKVRSDVSVIKQEGLIEPSPPGIEGHRVCDSFRHHKVQPRKGVSSNPDSRHRWDHRKSIPEVYEGAAALKSEQSEKRRKVLAIASKGGHWIELLRLRPALAESDVTFVTTDPTYRTMVQGEKFIVVCEATRKQKLCLLWSLCQIFWLLLTLRPYAIISTGAAPGYLAVRLGKLLGAKTLWIDSMANAGRTVVVGAIGVQTR